MAISTDLTTLPGCPVCSSRRLAVQPTPGRWIGPEVFESLRGRIGLMNCRDCGLDFVNPRPSSALLGLFYAGNTYDCHETGGSASAGASADFLLSRVLPCLPAGCPRSVLDYGAGGGGFLLHMRALNWETKGMEPGRRGLSACRAAGLDVTDQVDELPTGAYGLVTLHHVFEHLEHPGEVLDTVRRVLAPGGRLFIEVPNRASLRARLAWPVLSRRMRIDERHRAYPIHLVYHDVRTLTRVLADNGWKVEKSFTVGMGLDEYLVNKPARDAQAAARPAARTTPPETAASPAPSAKKYARSPRRFRRLVRDAYLRMGLGENLAVIARPD